MAFFFFKVLTFIFKLVWQRKKGKEKKQLTSLENNLLMFGFATNHTVVRL